MASEISRATQGEKAKSWSTKFSMAKYTLARLKLFGAGIITIFFPSLPLPPPTPIGMRIANTDPSEMEQMSEG